MNTIKLGVSGDSSSLYELIEILKIKGCDGGIVYEIHNISFKEFKEPSAEFKKRSEPYNKAFITSYYVDEWACEDISYAAKVDNVWYFVENTGSNTYLGTGPTCILRMRQYCLENRLRILYVEDNLNDWRTKLFSTQYKVEEKTLNNYSEAQSYKELNTIIKRIGDGISSTIKTSQKLNENNFRDLFLSAFRAHNNYIVTAESNNRLGRTDLLIADRQSEKQFIYEFKINEKNSDVENGLTQILFQYPTLQNKFNGLVLINRKKCLLSDLISAVEEKINSMEITITEIVKERDEHTLIVKHKHCRDLTLNCILTIYVFDIQE